MTDYSKLSTKQLAALVAKMQAPKAKAPRKKHARKGKIIAAARDASGRLRSDLAKEEAAAALVKRENEDSIARLRKAQDKRLAEEAKAEAKAKAKKEKADAKAAAAAEKLAKKKALADEKKGAAEEKARQKAEEKRIAEGYKAAQKDEYTEQWHQALQVSEQARIQAGIKPFAEGKMSKAKAASAAKAWYRGIIDEAIKSATRGATKNLIDRLKPGIK